MGTRTIILLCVGIAMVALAVREHGICNEGTFASMGSLRRTLLIAFLAVPLPLWASSYVWTLGVRRGGGTWDYDVWLNRGSLCGSMAESTPSERGIGEGVWHGYCYYTLGHTLVGLEIYDRGSVAGFNGQRLELNREGYYWGFIRIPLWFPSFLDLLLGWWVLRQGRRKRARGFPVQPGGAGGPP